MTSPYAHIIHTNHVPSTSELHEIKVFLLEPESELRRLETELARIRSILNDLESEHDKLKTFVDTHKALISPVRRLPPEILQEIFVRCLSETRNAVMHRSEAPMLLTEVCVEWRKIALATPALWSTLHLNFPDTIESEEMQVHFDDVAEAWLTRSGVLPLSISVYDKIWGIRRPTVFDLLDPFIRRCKRLQLSIINPDIDKVNRLVLPMLEDITISDWCPPGLSAPPKSYGFLKDILSLKKATLLGIYDLEPAFYLPLAQLEVLHLHCYGTTSVIPTQTLEILKSCWKLQAVSLSFESARYSLEYLNALGHEPVTIPLLHSFYILADNSLLTWMLERLILPAIRVLGISKNHPQSYVGITNDLPAQLESFLARSSHALEKFVFHPLLITPATLIACLSLVPDITELDLNGSNLYYRNSQVADVTLNEAILRSLTRTLDNPEDLIRSRWQAVPPGTARLAYANIKFDQPLNPTISSHLDTFRAEGLDISVASPSPTPESMTPWDGLSPRCILGLDTEWSQHSGFYGE